MHIAWLGKKTPVCGNVIYGREITNALRDRGYCVSFIHFTEEVDETDTLEVPLPFLYKSTIYTLPSLRTTKVLVDALRSLKPDLVHASLALSPLDFRLPEICAELDLPLVATFHSPFDPKRRNLTSSTQQLTYQIYAPSLADYDQVIIFSELQRNYLNKLGVPNSRLAVIPNGVDVDKYCPGASGIKAELDAKILFVYQGRLAPEKNIEVLLRAWHRAQMPEGCKLAIVGGGVLATGLKALHSYDPSIIWLGFIAEEARRIEILRGADVFILPSLVEGLSLSLLEAMACGTACLATDVGADGEVLDQGAGIVLDPRRVFSQLVTLLPILAQQPEWVEILKYKARQRVLERYTLDRNISRLEALYHQVLEQSRHRLVIY
ncbi:MAG: glycosyltransferase family 4 protein [Pseudanabaenaceae cyanobacterium]